MALQHTNSATTANSYGLGNTAHPKHLQSMYRLDTTSSSFLETSQQHTRLKSLHFGRTPNATNARHAFGISLPLPLP